MDINRIIFSITRGYCRYIGSGSCREVFDLGNGYVVKIAKNAAGIAQNKTEYYISRYDNSNLFAKVIDVSKNFEFLIMERADKVYNITEIWRYFDVKSKKEMFDLKQIKNISQSYNLLLCDLNRQSSWGVINGRPVIIDYGFTREVKEKYY